MNTIRTRLNDIRAAVDDLDQIAMRSDCSSIPLIEEIASRLHAMRFGCDRLERLFKQAEET